MTASVIPKILVVACWHSPSTMILLTGSTVVSSSFSTHRREMVKLNSVEMKVEMHNY